MERHRRSDWPWVNPSVDCSSSPAGAPDISGQLFSRELWGDRRTGLLAAQPDPS
jgi:hypothetical protein